MKNNRAVRRALHVEPWSKITVTLLDRHAAYLDVMRTMMRLRHHNRVARAEFIRAFVDFMVASDLDFSQFSSMEQIVEWLVDRFEHSGLRRSPELVHMIVTESLTPHDLPPQTNQEGA